MCCLCFQRYPIEELNRDENGVRENVCLTCATQEQEELAVRGMNDH